VVMLIVAAPAPMVMVAVIPMANLRLLLFRRRTGWFGEFSEE
jgi:hypothetical protein